MLILDDCLLQGYHIDEVTQSTTCQAFLGVIMKSNCLKHLFPADLAAIQFFANLKVYCLTNLFILTLSIELYQQVALRVPYH